MSGFAVQRKLYPLRRSDISGSISLQPYVKNFPESLQESRGKLVLYSAPPTPSRTNLDSIPATGTTGYDYGGQNSYGHNDPYMSPATPFSGGGTIPQGVNYSTIPRVSSTVMVVDGTYYGSAPDVTNASGFTIASHLNGNEATYITAGGAQYINYWENIASGTWSSPGGSQVAATNVSNSLNFFNGKVNVQWVDGHTKSLPYQAIIGDICYWTTDADGAHPACG